MLMAGGRRIAITAELRPAVAPNVREKKPVAKALSSGTGTRILLVGGGSLLRDLDHVLRQETKLPILRSEDPYTAVVHGAGRALDDLSLLREVALH